MDFEEDFKLSFVDVVITPSTAHVVCSALAAADPRLLNEDSLLSDSCELPAHVKQNFITNAVAA